MLCVLLDNRLFSKLTGTQYAADQGRLYFRTSACLLKCPKDPWLESDFDSAYNSVKQNEGL